MSQADDLACAALCEEHGFPRQAEIFRALAGGSLTVHVVAERPTDDEGYLYEQEGGTPVALFLDPDVAAQDARHRNIRAYRERDILAAAFDVVEAISDLSTAELERRIGEILGAPYRLPADGEGRVPLFPASASDSQLGAIVDLLTVRFFHVVPVQWGG